MKAVLISIKPKWCELIEQGKKTVEVRKTKPKIDVPFKCYIYETNWKDNTYWKHHHEGKLGKVIGEFVCDNIIVAECGNYVAIPTVESCLHAYDLLDYADEKTVYGWHITDLVIYDKPKELGEFRTPCKMRERLCGICDYAVHGMDGDLIDCDTSLERPPQSWCYVEELGV